MKMGREDGQFIAAKRAYRNAAEAGNRQEEAKWANVIGDILKNRGEYVEALKWLRIDYEVSVKHLPEKHLLPTCQSLGEIYLRLQHFKDALIYQKKHLELARDTKNLVEQQRASTQLGRTFHEMFLKSDDDHCSVRNAKKYFVSAMKLAQTLKENPPSNKYTFLKEYIDAHNNIGMLEMDLDNLEEAQKILTKALQICDEEEVIEDDDGRTRLHHNLGNVYTELRKWDKAREHIEKDIVICKKIGHCQGEAKGYINLGELHYRVQKYEEANLCYQKALDLAKSMEDEDALVSQIDQNIEIVKQAIKVMEELKKEEQYLKKLTRNMGMARGTSGERKCLLQQNASLDRLIEKSSMIFAWRKHCEFAKRKKKIASELCDKEKLGDSFVAIGESYQKLRNFKKALKWYTKGWETYNAIGNLEGQALAKVNIGGALDSNGNWANALEAFNEGYRIACQANLPSAQLDALENMHYSQMIRFDNVEEARRLQSLIDKIKQSNTRELDPLNVPGDCCSETDTEGDDRLSNRSDMSYSPKMSKSKLFVSEYKSKDDMPLISFLRANDYSRKQKATHTEKSFTTTKPSEDSPRSMTRSAGSLAVGRKRCRLILSDDEDENNEVQCTRGRVRALPQEDVATSYEFKSRHDLSSPARGSQDNSPAASKCAISACTPVHLEESTSSYKCRSSKLATETATDFRFSSASEAVKTSYCGANGLKSDTDVFENICKKHDLSGPDPHVCDDKYCQHIIFKIEDDFVHVEPGPCKFEDKISIEDMKVEVACLYFLKLISEERSWGLLPIIRHMNCGGRAQDSLETIDALKDYMRGNRWIEVSIDAWVPKRLVKLYVECCKELSESPNMKMLKKLYKLEVSEDEIIVSDCELQDIAVTPLLNALHLHKTVAVLDLSHNLLGNETMEKLQQVFMSSSQKYGGLVLDLHCNCFGPTALFQICECPVLFVRLEVLNISGNRLTDGCASYLSTILQNCKALYSLNIERCSITSRTIQKIADSLASGSVLAQICIGYNSPISGNAIVNLLNRLATIKCFSELNLNGIKLSKYAINSLCNLTKTSCLSELMLADTSIGTDDALQLTESWTNATREQVKLDLSSCMLTSEYVVRLDAEVSLISGILELNLGGNPIRQEGGSALASLLKKPQCCLKVLVLCKCHLGLTGVLSIVRALAEESSLEELNLAENALQDDYHTLLNDSVTAKECLDSLQTDPNSFGSSIKVSEHDDAGDARHEYPLEVADSEDELTGVKPSTSGFDGSCMSSSEKNLCNLKSPFIKELSTAICIAKELRVLDLSNNGFSEQMAETLYTAWSKSSRGSSTQRHIQGQTIHLSVQDKHCCGMKPCCRRF